jgi:hypothetical protein
MGDRADSAGVKTSQNPWKLNLGNLKQPRWNLELDGHPLNVMKEILMQWPGEEAVNLSDEDRHQRFVRCIAGYPQIDVGRVPFDWPMHPKSIKSLKLSMLLDTFASPDKSVSLRSAILNIDLNYRQGGDNLQNIHKQCLVMMFRQLRIITNQIDESDNFTTEEFHFLCSLHGTDNDSSMPWWPWNEMFKDSDLFVQKPELPNPTNDEMASAKGDRQSELRTRRNGWNSYKSAQKTWEIFHYKGDTESTIKVEFVKIQSWINHWCDVQNMGSTTQRLWRGASSILESVLARLRHIIIERYGVGSIIIDGGGRIEFLSKPGEEVDWEEIIFKSLLIQDGVLPIYNLQIKEIIEKFSCGEEKLQKTFERNIGTKFTKAHLPSFKIHSNGEQINTVVEDYQINDNCIICDKSNPEILTDWDQRMKNIKSEICLFHRLLYSIGHATRKKDTSIRTKGRTWQVPSVGSKVKRVSSGRKVIGISRLDLNSLGIIFSSSFDDTDNRNSVDIRRRRCFRFNALWWQIVQRSIDDEELEIDSVAAWIAAGDDITIAEYANAERRISESPGLVRCLYQLDNFLNQYFDDELGHSLSFCAGYSVRENGKSLLGMMNESTISEKLIKMIWKTKMKEKHPDLLKIFSPDGKPKEIKKFCSAKTNQDEIKLNNGLSMILKYQDGLIFDCKNSSSNQCKPNSNCSTNPSS